MRFDPDRHRRGSMRASWWDYAGCGAYFVTICTHHRLTLFGDVVDGRVYLSPAGTMAAESWAAVPDRFSGIALDAYVVMPNHLHGIVVVRTGRHDESHREQSAVVVSGTSDGSLGRVIQAFKSLTTVAYGRGVREHGWQPFDGRLWQRNYYDHIIRNADELGRVRAYIARNPARWAHDAENPAIIRTNNPM
ncbi:MAG TPA: hypothetical protein PKA95_10050 [Thermomicrobiales bacterium]|nr:hypothetical protein [Thermomicrobiales bacterium]